MIYLWIYVAGVVIFFILGLLAQPADQPFIKNLQEMFNFKKNRGEWLGLIFWPLSLIAVAAFAFGLCLACSLSSPAEDYYG